MVIFIDIGGTPEKVLEKDRTSVFDMNDIAKTEVIAILDPFDLARAQRRLFLGDYKFSALNFSVDVPNGYVDLNSEQVSPPSPKECRRLFEQAKNSVIGKIQSVYGKRVKIPEVMQRYDSLTNQIVILAQESSNLRDFMDGLVNMLAPDIKTKRLEEVLSENYGKISGLLEKTDIPVRAICSNCNRFTDFYLRQEFPTCQKCNKQISSREIMQSGRYIPQNGFFAVIIYLCGYKMLSNSEEKARQAEEINRLTGENLEPLFNFKESNEYRTLFESFILGGQNETSNSA